MTFATGEDALKAYESGRCDSYTTDSSGLYGERQKLADPSANIVLPEIISKEPLSPAVRHGDDQWADIVRWTHYVMLDAEELGINKSNVDEKLKSDDPETRRLLGVEGQYGEALGLTNDWAYRIIKHVGNYGESFERIRARLALEDRSRPQRAVDQGRTAIRATNSLSARPPFCREPADG